MDIKTTGMYNKIIRGKIVGGGMWVIVCGGKCIFKVIESIISKTFKYLFCKSAQVYMN